MTISVFDLFTIGIGPSSSHTVGPMLAAYKFCGDLENKGFLSQVERLKVDLYGSLALTGKGHKTDYAILLGAEGYTPAGVDPEMVPEIVEKSRANKKLDLMGKRTIVFDEEHDLLFHKDKQLPFHPNAIRFTAYDKERKELYTDVIYSIGGGFLVDHASAMDIDKIETPSHQIPYPFETALQLLEHCSNTSMTISQIVMENEKSWREESEIRAGLLNIWQVMRKSIEKGCLTEGILPGGLNVRRRAASIYHSLSDLKRKRNPAELMEWVSLWAMAVNEENAAGGRVVTAPTNGAAGVIPSVIQYYISMTEDAGEEGIVTFLLVAGAMGVLFKKGASISAAEMGCMGEVGVACSMAAAGLTAALGGSNLQIENAAEIGMEHNLGLTCDPIMGLVQIPCIERNTMGAVKAINAMLLALQGDGIHHVSLDQVIATMKQTGHDMQTIYKETSLGGLAVNVPEC